MNAWIAAGVVVVSIPAVFFLLIEKKRQKFIGVYLLIAAAAIFVLQGFQAG